MRYKTFQMSVKKVQLKGCQANKFNSIKKQKTTRKYSKYSITILKTHYFLPIGTNEKDWSAPTLFLTLYSFLQIKKVKGCFLEQKEAMQRETNKWTLDFDTHLLYRKRETLSLR